MKSLLTKLSALFLLGTLFIVNCSGDGEYDPYAKITWDIVQDSTQRMMQITGFSGPEAVRYDPGQDVYFVSNFNGGGNDRDANGFISKVGTGGDIDSLKFMTGTEDAPLHAPRGMFITGETLWAADVDGVHQFNRRTGEQTGFTDFSEFEPGFLNDVAAGPDNNIYVTDTGNPRLFRIANGQVEIARDSLSVTPNGVTMHPTTGELVLAPWGGDRTFLQWNLESREITTFAVAETGGNYDGIEFVGGQLLAASQQDSSLHLITENRDDLVIHVSGRPADIGIDTQRMQVAVPYIALNQVDVWQLPKK